MNLLARREHSQYELHRKLKSQGYTDNLILDVLRELAQESLQSDARFTENYLRMRVNRGYGPLRIRAELRERGITEDIISQFLNENDKTWVTLAEQVLIKKFGKTLSKDFKARAKQLRFLQYRGFNFSYIDQQ